MTTHGRGALEREASIGSVTDRVIDAANCPVFLVPISVGGPDDEISELHGY